VMTDKHTGRTDSPSGFFLYNAEPDDVFLPNHPPLRPLLDMLTGGIINQKWEAWSYVGFSTVVIFLVLIFLAVKEIFARKKAGLFHDFFKSRLLNISFIASFIVLLFAMGFPFKQFPGLLDHLPFVEQFRATGRFTWPFYFAATVFAATVMQTFWSGSVNRVRKTLALTLCIGVGIFNIAEGIAYHAETSAAIVKSGNFFRKEYLPVPCREAVSSIDPGKYQAILALPFYYQGSESYARPRNEETVRASILVSYHTGLPLVCANLTRTSVQESKNIVQIVSPGFYKKTIRDDLPSDKPFLVIRTRDAITNYEKEIFDKCKPVFEGDEISVFAISSDDLFYNASRDVFDRYRQHESSLYPKEQFVTSDTSSFLYFNGFEELTSDQVFRGKGGFQSVKKGKNTLAEFPAGSFATGKKYHVSIWMYNGMENALNMWFRFIIEEYDASRDTWITTTTFPIQSETINGDWSLIESTFGVKNPQSRISVVTKGKDDAKEAFYADDLLIREDGVNVFRMNASEDTLFYNNHEIIDRK
ncbi:MAG: hypothetical protein MUC31_00275, partial [Bacteroidales bacterium]|nr:hypothetical protein [Bacteroidales bacterium]